LSGIPEGGLMDKLEFRQWNETMFKRFGNERLYLHPNPLVRYIENTRVKIISKLLRAKEYDRILDVGCGEAYIMKRLKGNLVGIDLSSKALALAANRLKLYGTEGDLVMADARFLPFMSRCFDKVVCSELLEHIPSPGKAISEVSRVIKRGGKVAFTIPNEEKINLAKRIVKFLRLFNLLLKDLPERMDNQWHLHVFSLPLIKRIIADNGDGLKVSKIVKIPFFFSLRLVILCTLR